MKLEQGGVSEVYRGLGAEEPPFIFFSCFSRTPWMVYSILEKRNKKIFSIAVYFDKKYCDFDIMFTTRERRRRGVHIRSYIAIYPLL